MGALFTLCLIVVGVGTPDHPVEKQVVVTITATQLEGGVLSEIAWDRGVLLMQGIVAEPDGRLSPHYVVVPVQGVGLKQLAAATPEARKYWDRKASRVSPTGLGRITSSSDASMPMYGVGTQATRIGDAYLMGGMHQKHLLRLGPLVLQERDNDEEPYDGEVWSWSPPELNRIAYVGAGGDLWVADADGTHAERVLKGHFTLPAWSDDGRMIAVAETKERGRRWEISIVHLPPALALPRQR
jgi:hypothetical protein